MLSISQTTDMSKETLYVVTSVFNPENTKIRYKLYYDFKDHMLSFPNVVLLTIELVFGDAPFVVTSSDNKNHFQFRTNDILWYKENLNNIVFKHLYKLLGDVKVAWIDADIEFQNKNWVNQTLYRLYQFKFLQLFDTCDNLGPRHEVMSSDPGFIYNWKKNSQSTNKKGRSGLAWASTTETLDQIGYLIDWDIVGASDWFQVFALTGQYCWAAKYCREKNIKYAENLDRIVRGSVGHVDGKILHFFHGYPSDRGYDTRGQILTQNQFDPDVDIGYRKDGLLCFTTDKPKLKQDVIEHFKSKRERGPEDILTTTAN